MKKSKANGAQGELAKSQLDTPVSLTPEQLEIVAAGFKPLGGKGMTGSTTTSGAIGPRGPVLKLLGVLN